MLCGSCFLRRMMAVFLIFVGVILLICFTPVWVWLLILGAALVGIGCVILKKK